MTQITFHYQAVDRLGARTKGVIRAESRNDAFRRVVATGLQPVHIAKSRSDSRRGKRVSLKDLSHFTYQISVLMEARIPIVSGLRSIGEQETNPALRAILEDLAAQIEGGKTVTDALSAHRHVFGDVYVETIRAAETSGNMILVLANLAEMLDRQYELKKNVKGALMYPAAVIGALILALGFLMVFVVPKFATMFESRGVELPVPTQVLIAISGGMRDYWFLILGAAVGAWFGRTALWNHPVSRARIDTALHRVPFLRDVLKGLAVSRFSQVFGLSIRSGLSLIDALEMAGNSSGRPLLQADAQKMKEQVNRGGRLTDVLSTCEYIPPFARRMLAAGEEAAEMSKMCAIVARHYDREVSHLTKNVTTVIEPIMIVGLAGVVLVIALAIFLPMWNMAALIK